MSGIEYFILANPILTYAILFFAMFIEGEGVILLASVFAWQGHLNWVFLGLSIIAGTITGDMIWYLLGRFLRGTRLGMWLDKHYEKSGGAIGQVITEHYGKFAILSKFLYFTTHPTIFIVGWHGLTFRRFTFITAYASILWALTVLGIGYFFGYAISLIGFRHIIKRIELLVIGLFIILFIIERLLKKIFKKRLLHS